MEIYILIYNEKTILYSGKQSEMETVLINANTRIETFNNYQDLYDRTQEVEKELFENCPDPIVFYKELWQILNRLDDIQIDLCTNRKAKFKLGQNMLKEFFDTFTDVKSYIKWDIIDRGYGILKLENLMEMEDIKNTEEEE